MERFISQTLVPFLLKFKGNFSHGYRHRLHYPAHQVTYLVQGIQVHHQTLELMHITYASLGETGEKTPSCSAPTLPPLPLTVTAKAQQSNFLISWMLTLTFTCFLTRVRTAISEAKTRKTKTVMEKALSCQKRGTDSGFREFHSFLKIKG